MKEIIEQAYPGTPLLISEWNFGADADINGAAGHRRRARHLRARGRRGRDVLAQPGGRQPGYFAFKMHGNYDGAGARFGGDVLQVTSSDEGVSAFAAVDPGAGVVRVMLINKDPAAPVGVAVTGIESTSARRFSYRADALDGIESATADISAPILLAPSSITVLEIPHT